jgi:hypothetical protein
MGVVMNNQRGQLVVEAILLMTVLLGITMAVSSFLQKNKIAQNLTFDPWSHLSSMIECGSWSSCRTLGVHPSTADRGLSLKPEGQ